MAIDAPHATRGSSWIYGPAPDLLLGAGAAYLLTVPLFWLVASGAVAADWGFAGAWIIGVLINGPHYGATLVRVYGQREERRKYALFALWATLLLGLAFVVGVHEPLVGSLLVTVYFTWSPWHFASQNYGISLMFLRRSGAPVAPRAKRLLQASFALSFVLTVLALHVEGSTSLQAPTRGAHYAADAVTPASSPASASAHAARRAPGLRLSTPTGGLPLAASGAHNTTWLA